MKTVMTAVVGLAVAASIASASTTLVTSRAALGGTDSIDWGQFGSTFTSVANPSAGLTTNAMGFTVSQTKSAAMERRDQGSGWAGNFSSGERLLWTTGADLSSPNAICIDLAGDVNGAGAQIQSDYFGAFIARIELYDASNTLLGTHTLAGSSTSSGDGSAIFIGATSSGTDIRRICFSMHAAPGGTIGDFAINQVDLGSGGVVVPLPTAGGLALASMGVLAARRRRMA